MNCLIVDDDPSITLVLNRLIQRLGHSVNIAQTAKDGFYAMRKKKFDLIVLAHLLPDGTSGDLSATAAVTQPNCRIILLAEGLDFPDGAYAQAAPGADWLCRKPIVLTDLAALIDYAAEDTIRNPSLAQAVI